MCHGISPVSPVQSKHPCKKERWTGKDLPCKFVPVISPSCRGYLVGTYKPRGVPVSYLMQVKNPFFFKKKKKKKKGSGYMQTSHCLGDARWSWRMWVSEHRESPLPYSVHFTCRRVAFVSGRGISIVPVLPGMCILSPWKDEVVHGIDE